MKNPICIIYNGANRPFSVFDDTGREYDFYMRDGFIDFHLSGFGHKKTYCGKLKKGINRKIWFVEKGRPDKKTDKQIKNCGFIIIKEPLHFKEILELIND